MDSSGTKKLNPGAKEWNPVTEKAPEEHRSLFITFSNGCSVTHAQLWEFFQREFGPCVESIYVHNPQWPGGSPQFGRIRFKTMALPACILEGGEERKLMVDGRPILCKKYDPQKKNLPNTEASRA